jgi:hypothetical protein
MYNKTVWADGTAPAINAQALNNMENGIYSANQVGNPNLFINGSFNIWKRGNSFSNTGDGRIYTADRWSVAGPCTVSRNGNSISYSNNDTTTEKMLSYIMEKDETNMLLGKTLTVSFDVYGSANMTTNVRINDFNMVLIAMKSYSVTSTKQRVAFTFTMPSSMTNELQIDLIYNGLNSQNGQSITISDAKLEVGAVSTPNTLRPYAEELVLCDRYYRKVTINDCSGDYITDNNIRLMFPVFGMRVSPACVPSNMSYLIYGNNTVLTDIYFNYPLANSDLTGFTGFEFKTDSPKGINTNVRVNVVFTLDSEIY